MCLEDRFLFALYNRSGFVPVKAVAEEIFITENALLSIIHRIQTGYPDFLVLKKEHEQDVFLSSNTELQKEVRMFLADGGFTAINEQDLRDYYEIEMQDYTRLQKLKSTLQKYGWIRWMAGGLLAVSTGVGVAALLKKRKK